MTSETAKYGKPRRTKGQASREAILATAAKLATTKGLESLSIAELAAAVGMSKSGLYAHFKAKEDLELATIAAAVEIFDREVLQPAMTAPPGPARIRELSRHFLSHLERGVFPGGCFFSSLAAELDTRPGPTRDRVAEMVDRWLALFRESVVVGQRSGELDPKADVAQIVFEIEAMHLAANFLFVMTNDKAHLVHARRGVDAILERLAARRG